MEEGDEDEEGGCEVVLGVVSLCLRNWHGNLPISLFILMGVELRGEDEVVV